MTFTILFYLSVILFGGLIMGRAVKLIRLPNVTGYLLAGLLLGPCVLGFLPAGFVHEMELVSEMALALIALTIGAEFEFSYLKNLLKIILIGLRFGWISMYFIRLEKTILKFYISAIQERIPPFKIIYMRRTGEYGAENYKWMDV